MFCQNCGTENPEEARFCQKCGSPLLSQMDFETEDRTELEQENEWEQKKKGGRRWLLAGAAFLLVAFCIACVLVVAEVKERQDYENYIASAEKYLEDLDYENAEEAYLKAIEVDPKKAEAYLGLADTYYQQEDIDKAQDILAQGKKAASKKEAAKIENSGSASSGGSNGGTAGGGTAKVENDYTWVIEPKVEADDIYYIKDENVTDYCRNDLNRQMDTAYAVMKQDDTYGLIGLDGQMGADLEYQGVGALSEYYLLEREEPVYESEYQTEMTDYYFVEEEEKVEPAVAVIGDAGSYLRGTFYYHDGLRNTAEYVAGQGYGMTYQQKPERATPVKQSEVIYDGSENELDWYEELDSDYAICDRDGELVTDFIYEECGSASSGLLAVKQDGKWGYVDEQGQVVIPLEYDASCSYETCVFDYDTENEPETVEYCYAASDGYVPLCKDGEWELRDTSGELAIPSGVFDTIRPVYEGKCWVEKDGKWGVIQVEEEASDSSRDPADQTVTGNVQTVLSSASRQEIAEMVIEHLEDALLEEDGGSYSISEDETTETDTQYISC
ncbi:MAG TPA: WG repeat-containing protein [Candidatus Dorea gallistercoris]|uniref:WG repeat-containing protein n=1 Tax=Candidatus Dorea gallistercoris TaxID=2838542 RepID=A0A9D1R834_9FIRM|nr:WG repeat-containing protein [Candidatus Dorea gallistercoris]